MIRAWICEKCGAMNSDWRTHCHNCSEPKPMGLPEETVKKINITINSKDLRINENE